MPTDARQKMLVIDAFDGLVNKRDTLRFNQSAGNNIATAGLAVADNLDIDDEGKLEKAQGFENVNTENITDAFATMDETRMYFITGAILKEMHPDFTSSVLHLFSNVAPKHARWAEVNKEIYVSYADEHLIISRDASVRPWGIQPPGVPTVTVTPGRLPEGQYQAAVTYWNPTTGQESGAIGVSVATVPPGTTGQLNIQVAGAPPTGYHFVVYVSATDGDVLYRAIGMMAAGNTVWDGAQVHLSAPLRTLHMEGPPPVIDQMTVWQGRIWCAQYFPESNTTGIFASGALQYEHFDLLEDVVYVTGEVLVLEAANEGIIIGTEDEIFGYNGDVLSTLADYGCVRGSLSVMDKGKAYVWTQQGLISAFPFEELTDPKVNVAPGVLGSAVLIEQDGYKKVVAIVEEGGTAYNPSEA